jgi:hypothetical protein
MRAPTVSTLLACFAIAAMSGCQGSPTGGSAGLAPVTIVTARHARWPLSVVAPAASAHAGTTYRQPAQWMRLAPDAAKGRAYVSQFTQNYVNEYPSNNERNVAPLCQIQKQTYVNGLGVDAAKNLWVPAGNASGTGTTNEFAPNCGKRLFSIPDSDGQPAAIAFDRKHNVYVLNIFGPAGYGSIDVYAPGKKTTKTVLRDDSAFLWFDEAFDPAGNLYMVYSDVYNLGHVVEFAHAKNPPAPLPMSIGFPGGLTFDVNGNMLVVDQDAAAVSVYAPPFTGSAIATFPLQADSIPCRFANSKRLYCSNPTTNSIDVYNYDPKNPSGTTYAYSFNNGIQPRSENAGIALSPTPQW